MAEHIIDIDHITKRFGDNTVINDLSLSVEQGEVLVLVGPSGLRKKYPAPLYKWSGNQSRVA